MFKLTIVFDNTTTDAQLVPLWGFAAIIEFDGKKMLFDTGSNGRVLKKNIEKLGYSFSDLQYVFISHPHWDHIGGWDTVAEENPDLVWYVPASLSSHLIEDLKKFARKVLVVELAAHLTGNLYSTGVMATEGEHSLVLDTNQGLIIITGCGHPGIDNIIAKAREIKNKPVYYLAGGFHLLHYDKEKILDILAKTDVRYVTPTHCTGDEAQKQFDIFYGNRVLKGGVGKEIKLEI